MKQNGGHMKIFRKRFIPNEVVDISNDEVIYRDTKKLITKWIPIKPRENIAYGESCVYFEKGWKISKFYRKDGSFKFWYCDIIQYEYDEKEDTYILIDLLLDVIVHTDGTYEVLDEDELKAALKKEIISQDIAKEAEEKLKELIQLIQEGKFHTLDF